MRYLVVGIAIASSGRTAAAQRPIPDLAIENATVIAMQGERLAPRMTVVIRDGKVAAIGPTGQVTIPRGAVRVPGTGRFLVPGLTDTHVHLEGQPETWLPLFLTHGVTTVINLRGGPEHLALARRIRSGELAGPEVFTSGPFLNEPQFRTVDSVVQEATRQKEAGYDFVKVHGNLSAEAYAALARATRELGIPLIGHAPRNLPFDAVLDHRQIMVAHAEELIYTKFKQLDSTAVPAIAQRMAATGTWLTPNLAMYHGIATQWGDSSGADSSLALPERRYLNDFMNRVWTERNPYTRRNRETRGHIERSYRFLVTLTGILHRAGVPLLAGTDTPLPIMYPGHSLHDELDELAAAGLGPFEALETATVNPGRFLRPERAGATAEIRGVIEPGAVADLLLIDGNPLEDLRRLRRPAGVVLRGRWLPRSQLDSLVSAATAANRRE
jgi:hypothetical protein